MILRIQGVFSRQYFSVLLFSLGPKISLYYCFSSWYGYMINDVSISKVSKQFFKTFIAIRSFFNGVGFETSFFELLTAVSTDKTLGMKFLFHGSYNTSTNSFPTNTAVMDFPDDNNMVMIDNLLLSLTVISYVSKIR